MMKRLSDITRKQSVEEALSPASGALPAGHLVKEAFRHPTGFEGSMVPYITIPAITATIPAIITTLRRLLPVDPPL